MTKTKLDLNDIKHQLLVGTLSMFVDNFGYHPRDLYELMRDCEKKLWHGFMEIYYENKNKNKVDEL